MDRELKVLGLEAWCDAARARLERVGGTVSTTHSAITPFVLYCTEVRLVSGDWLPISASGHLLAQQMSQLPENQLKKSPYIKKHEDGRFALAATGQRAIHIDKAIVVGGNANYYHWLIDFLPRFHSLRCADYCREWPVIVNNPLSSFQVATLELAGVSEDRLIKTDEGVLISIGEAIIPSMLSSYTALHPDAIAWLRRIVLSPSHELHRGPGRRLFVSRRDAGSRQLVNEDAVHDFLEPYGFERFCPGNLGFHEQVKLFSTAQIMIGPHGAGLTNLLFAPMDAVVIDIKHVHGQALFFETLAMQLGQRYEPLIATRVANSDAPLHDQHMVIAPEQVLLTVSKFL